MSLSFSKLRAGVLSLWPERDGWHRGCWNGELIDRGVFQRGKDGVRMALVPTCRIKPSLLLWEMCVIKMIMRCSSYWCHQYVLPKWRSLLLCVFSYHSPSFVCMHTCTYCPCMHVLLSIYKARVSIVCVFSTFFAGNTNQSIFQQQIHLSLEPDWC